MRSRPLLTVLLLLVVAAVARAAFAQPPYGMGPPPPTPMGPPASPVSLSDQSPPLAPAVEARGIWIEMKTLPADADGIRKVVRQLARCNFNFLLLEVTYEGSTLFPGPCQDPRFRGLDPLRVAIEEAHKSKMEVHPWVWTLKQSRWRDADPQPGGPVLARHPEWASINQAGQKVSPGASYYWLCPSRTDAREYVVSQVEDLARRYPIDGIHLDYVRFERMLVKGAPPPYCFCDHCRSEYQKAGGADPVDIAPFTPEFRSWCQWRENLATSLVAEISARVKQVRPRTVVSAAVYPDSVQARRYFGQNWSLWLASRSVDFVTPMLYLEQTDGFARRLQRYVGEGMTALGIVLPGVGVNEIQNRIFSHDVLVEQVIAARTQGMLGSVLFSFSVMNPYLEQFLINKVYVRPAQVPFREEAAAVQRLTQQARALIQQSTSIESAREVNWLLARAGDLETVIRNRSNGPPGPPAESPIPVAARYQALPRLTAPGLTRAPIIDGSLSDKGWKDVPQIKLALNESGGWADTRTQVRIAVDAGNLYVAFHCEDSDLGETVARTRGESRRPWSQDHVAVFLDPGPSRSQYLVLRINPLGRLSLEKVPDGRRRPPGVGTPESVTDVLHWDGRVRRGKQFWNAEYRIPIRELMALHPGGHVIGLNLVRAHRDGRGLHHEEWIASYGSPYEPLRFATVDLLR